jgi:hypothetical protein
LVTRIVNELLCNNGLNNSEKRSSIMKALATFVFGVIGIVVTSSLALGDIYTDGDTWTRTWA